MAPATNARKKKKVTLCFNGQTIKKPKKQARKLEQQGATRGKCPCSSGQKLCNGACIPTANCCTTAECTSPLVCEAGSCVAARCGNGGPCKVFATEETFSGALGGAAGGDTLCQDAAEATGLPGTFKAWLSDSNSTPATRFNKTANAGPYVLVGNIIDDGNPPPTVATNFASLTSCGGGGNCLQNPINRTESGVILTETPRAWTGTVASGTVASNTCTNWTSVGAVVNGLFGSTTETSGGWTQFGSTNCNGTGPSGSRLYCFEQAT